MRLRVPAVAALSLVAALALPACGDDEATETTTATDAATEAGCEAVEAPEPKDVQLERPTARVDPGRRLTAAVETSCGTFEIALHTKGSPKTVTSFVHLAEEGLYDDTLIHRIVPGFLIQGGDPLGDGTGGPGYFVDERPAPDAEYTFGTVAMAKTEAEPPGRSGSQFFVVTAADAGLRPDSAVLGEVGRGRRVVARIASLGDPESGEAGTPLATVVVKGVTIRGS